MARRPLPAYVDTVIVGGGPASLILSYILHGHIPYYTGKHHDDLLHTKLTKAPNLLHVAPETYAHFASSLRYSTQALPLNTLLDTLIRPNADTEINPESCVEWRSEPDKAVSHVVLTDGKVPGGQWVDNPSDASWDIGTLSYSEMLSLPGYSYEEHYRRRHGNPLPEFERPSRADVADYYAEYPKAVGLLDTLHTSTKVDNISRTSYGFFIGSHGILCRHLVLATGIFSRNISPPPELSILQSASTHAEDEPILVIGSGFSAADVIISTSPHRKIIHLFKWTPDIRPSPLRGCHHQAYPEYAGVYRQMKLAAISARKATPAASPLMRRKSNPFFSQRDWTRVYEGLPNASIESVAKDGSHFKVGLRLESGEIIERDVGQLAYVIGRRGSLDYLDRILREELLPSADDGGGDLISGRTLRSKVELSFEVAPDLFVIGSLAGDSLVRHAFGGSVSAAGRIMGVGDRSPVIPPANGLPATQTIATNGSSHEDLHIDRREELKV